ncbi:hypothetical protein ABHO71_003698 [Stenotrophomonas maltophilia]|uniref:hypothetical protein n=1 Tax=Stenotrophomonas maltophilia TaxID=40324 RepID=UPI000B517A3D|nr:hypothetical protein [Stenotrophomonas maltophilia]ASE53766.1 hypothetical protein CEQ03_14140 [Stenotrophomonas maltophilia]HEL5360289.1 hypothetical protein [Stenotrophomonas maltophilia]
MANVDVEMRESTQVIALMDCPSFLSKYQVLQKDVVSRSTQDLYEIYPREKGSFLSSKYNRRGINFDRVRLGNFRHFLLHMGPKPNPTDSLDRIDNAKGYEVGNLRWASKLEQSQNRRITRWIEWNGSRYSRRQFARLISIPHARLRQQIHRGWTLAKIVECAAMSQNPLRDWRFDTSNGPELERLYRKAGAFGQPRIDFLLEYLRRQLKGEKRLDAASRLRHLHRRYERKRQELVAATDGLEMAKTDALLAAMDADANQAEEDHEQDTVQSIAKAKKIFIYID